MASEDAWHLRVLAENMDREELICNLVTVQMGRDALKKEIDEIQSYLLPPGAFPNTDAFIVKLRELKRENEQLKEEVKSVTAQFEHETKTGANSVLAHGDIEEWCLSVEAENKKLKEKALERRFQEARIQELEEENEEFRTVEKIIGENWGSLFKEAFEMIGVEDDLIECGFSTPEDFE